MFKILSAHPVSRYTVVAVILFVLVKGFAYKQWEELKIIDNDAKVYYSYLPAAFIYHDLTFQFYKTTNLDNEVKIFFVPDKNGIIVQKTTIGVALLQSPFFFIAHLYSKITGTKANGYTSVYQFWIFIAALFYLFIGLWHIQKTLVLFFDDFIVACTLIVIGLATNLYCYTVLQPGMSHVYSFAAISFFIYHSIKWMEYSTLKRAIIIGIVLGIIILVRLPDVLVLVFPFCWNIVSWQTAKSKIRFWINQWKQVLLIAIVSLLVFSVILF
jgi:hypothetical protein